MDLRKTLNKAVSDSDAIAKTARTTSGILKGGAIATGALIGSALIIDMFQKSEERSEVRKQTRKQERKRNLEMMARGDDGKDIAYMDMQRFENYVQNLWDERSKHSRTWGGNRY
jgi:hypothetical protein